MAGSLRAVPGRRDAWELRVYLGRDHEGRVRHRHARFVGARRQAERELARMVAEQDASPAPVPEEESLSWGPATTVNDAIAGWKANGWADLSPSTLRRYESIWNVHVRGSIGRRKIASLGPYEVERYFRSLKTAGLAEATVRQVRAILHRSCNLARRWSANTLPNPINGTELPEWTLAESSPAVRSPSAEEVRLLLKAAAGLDPRMSAFVRLVAATGMRRGEACAIRWSDVDSDAAVVRVDEGVVAVLGGARTRGPKTRASVRSVAVDAATANELRALRDEQENLASLTGVALAGDGFVFSTEPGGSVPPHPDSMSHAFARIRSAAGVAADVHLHSLRHFQSTQLDPVISEAQKQARLGWATVHMARHYTDSVPAEDRRAAEHIGGLLG